MFGHPRQGMLERSIPNEISSSSEGKRITAKGPIFSSNPLQAPPSALGNAGPSPLACPVPSCLFVLKGETPHWYFKRHLKYPGLHGRMGDEKEAWLNLHKIEHQRLLASLGSTSPPTKVLEVNQAEHVDIIKLVENNKAEEERKLRTAEFEWRAKNVGITKEELVAQKVAIWEGMWAAEQNGDNIGVSIFIPLFFGGFSRVVAD